MLGLSMLSALSTAPSAPRSSPKKKAKGSHVPSEIVKEQLFQIFASSTKDRIFCWSSPFCSAPNNMACLLNQHKG